MAEFMAQLLRGDLPAAGSVLGERTALCESCPRRKLDEPRLSHLFRPHEIIADDEVCLLDQGIVCCGPVTRSGCEHACISVNMPCTGCFGPPDGVEDQGAKLLSALAARFAAPTREEALVLAKQLLDPAGTLSRYALGANGLARRGGAGPARGEG